MFSSFYLEKGLMEDYSSRKDPNGLRNAVIVMVFLSLTFFPSKSGGSMLGRESEGRVKQMKLVLGSRPPGCVNKCLSCRPCTAALVPSPHHRTELKVSSRRDESYYLLSWKCKCKDKFFHP